MAEVHTTYTKKFELVMAIDEAIWLKGMLHNMIPEDEEINDKEIRRTLWEALQEVTP